MPDLRRDPHHRPSRRTATRWAAAGLVAAGALATAGPAGAAEPVTSRTWTVTAGTGALRPAAGVPGGSEALLWSAGSATTTLSGAGRVVLRARGDQCEGAPRAQVSVDGRSLGTVQVPNASGWWEYPVGSPVAAGAHRVVVTFTNDHRTASCDRNLRAGWVALAPTTATPTPPPPTTPPPPPAPTTATTATGNPFAAAAPFADPASTALRDAARQTDPVLRELELRAARPATSLWVGDWLSATAVRAEVARYTTEARAAGRTGVLTLYAIPGRDCGSYSAGGLSPTAYRTWVRSVADGLRGTRTAVVLEPDALAQLGACEQGDRLGLLRDAVTVLSDAGAVVYLDAGHSAWVPADVMARRLRQAGVDRARGFATNVSNYRTTADERAYGQRLSQLLGGKRFVVDTSRNGRGPGSTWCNPTGRGLGQTPRAVSDGTALDAVLWIKRPGQSDGTCGGGPSAGTWWPRQAQDLARNAAS